MLRVSSSRGGRGGPVDRTVEVGRRKLLVGGEVVLHVRGRDHGRLVGDRLDARRVLGDRRTAGDLARLGADPSHHADGRHRGGRGERDATGSAFYTWLYRIGINTAKNYLIALGRRAPTSTEFDSEEAEGFEDAAGLRDINTPESELASKQIAQTVNDAIAALPEELRTAITLRELDGLSYEEIAQIMSCPIGTVRSRIFRAREAVAEKLRPQLGTSKDKRW